MAKLTFFYDLSSPWTYLAFNNVQEVISDTKTDVSWRPFLVGVFNAVNQSVYAARSNPNDPKVIHNFTWLHEWARLAGLPLISQRRITLLSQCCPCVRAARWRRINRYSSVSRKRPLTRISPREEISMILRLWLILQTAWASMVTRWSNKPPSRRQRPIASKYGRGDCQGCLRIADNDRE